MVESDHLLVKLVARKPINSLRRCKIMRDHLVTGELKDSKDTWLRNCSFCAIITKKKKEDSYVLGHWHTCL